MSKFVIHKRGFFYTDEAFAYEEDALGSIVGTYDTLDKAEVAKKIADITSIQGLAGESAVDFFFDSRNFDEIYQRLETYYKSEYNLSIADKYRFDFPGKISNAQADKFLELLEITFHNIVEYDDDEELDPDDFNLEDQELGEF